MPPPVHPARRALPVRLGEDAVALLLGPALLFAGYVFAFATSLDQPLSRSLTFAAVNTVGGGVAALLFVPLVARFGIDRRAVVSAALHPLLAGGFAIAWYGFTVIGFALTPGWLQAGLRVAPFGAVALGWQLFQGVTLYAVLALFLHWQQARRALKRLAAGASSAPAAPAAPRQPGDALLVRCEKEVVPVDLKDLVRITGADGYSEVVTRDRRILSTTSLARFENILPADQFVRAHRSHIVRLAAVRNAEPAGNARLLLHLADGARIMTSRAGAKRLKELTV